ncbi:MAG: hypothetical protein ACE144_03725 [Thermodesulfobacteriota bacterium]
MKRAGKVTLLIVVMSFAIVNFCATGWAEDKWTKDDPVTDEWNMMDLLFARPMGVIAGVLGTGVFILSLPFTIPTGSVNDAAEMFVEKPFKFSFERQFPDENM